VRSRRKAPGRIASLVLAAIAASALLAPLGCTPKRVRLYEAQPVVEPRDNLIEYAITLLGKPYRSGGKGPNAFDCSGFVYHVYQRFDMKVPVSTEGLSKIGYTVSREEMIAGDIAIFNLKGGMHVGIMINPLEFIHASSSRGVAIDSLDFPYWKRSFSHFRRIL
jgi:cell wall-associated NlpC family hydrolase